MRRVAAALLVLAAGCGTAEKSPDPVAATPEERIAALLADLFRSHQRLASDPALEQDASFRTAAEKHVEELRPLLRARYETLLHGGLAVAFHVPPEHVAATTLLLGKRLEHFKVPGARILDFHDKGLVLIIPSGDALERFARVRTRIDCRGLLEFCLEAPLDQVATWKETGRIPAGCRVAQGKGEKLLVETAPVLDGSGIAAAEVRKTEWGPQAHLTFETAASERVREVTATSIGRRLAILFDGHALMAPVIQSQISGSASITGQFTEEEVADLVELLRLGPLPVAPEFRWELPFGAPKDGDPFDGRPPTQAWPALAGSVVGGAAIEEILRPRDPALCDEMLKPRAR